LHHLNPTLHEKTSERMRHAKESKAPAFTSLVRIAPDDAPPQVIINSLVLY